MVRKAGGADVPAKGPGLGTAVRYAPLPRNVYNTAVSFMTKGRQQTTKPPNTHTQRMAPTEPCLLGSLPGKGGALRVSQVTAPLLSSGHQQLGLDVLVSKWLWGKRTVNSS